MVRNFKLLNDRCRDLYEDRESLKEKLKTLTTPLVVRENKTLAPLAKVQKMSGKSFFPLEKDSQRDYTLSPQDKEEYKFCPLASN